MTGKKKEKRRKVVVEEGGRKPLAFAALERRKEGRFVGGREREEGTRIGQSVWERGEEEEEEEEEEEGKRGKKERMALANTRKLLSLSTAFLWPGLVFPVSFFKPPFPPPHAVVKKREKGSGDQMEGGGGGGKFGLRERARR